MENNEVQLTETHAIDESIEVVDAICSADTSSETVPTQIDPGKTDTVSAKKRKESPKKFNCIFVTGDCVTTKPSVVYFRDGRQIPAYCRKSLFYVKDILSDNVVSVSTSRNGERIGEFDVSHLVKT